MLVSFVIVDQVPQSRIVFSACGEVLSACGIVFMVKISIVRIVSNSNSTCTISGSVSTLGYRYSYSRISVGIV